MPLRLVLTLGDSTDRSQIVFLQTALAQYPGRLAVVLVAPHAPANLQHDLSLGCVRIAAGRGAPGLRLLAPDGAVVAAWHGFVPPKELGFTLRRHLGAPAPFKAAIADTARRGCR